MVILEWINSNGWIMTVIALFLGAMLTKRRELYLKYAEQKREHYSILFDILYAQDFNDRLYYYQKTNIILYGSRKVIEKLAIFEKNGFSITREDSKRDLFELIYEMKRDIENPKSTLSLYRRYFLKEQFKSNVNDILFDYKKEK